MWRAVRIWALASLLAAWLSGGAARAAPTAEETAEARRHHAIATRAYDLAEYEAALNEFKEAYRIDGDPAFLFNIAQCHRKLGHRADAVNFYRTYLRRAPDTPHRPEVEKFIADLEAIPPAPPPPAPAPQTTVEPPPPAPVTLVATPAQSAAATDQPVYTRAWFWVVTGAILVGAATAIVLFTRSDPAATAGPFACPDCVTTTPIGLR
jgi:tetratricopeptide (TPR) repeat protein